MSGQPYLAEVGRWYWECDNCGTICAGPSHDGEFGTTTESDAHALGDSHTCRETS